MEPKNFEPGIKLIVLITRNRRLSIERFHYHWHRVHGPLAREWCSRQAGGPINRYRQNHRIDAAPGDLPTLAFDGITEAWFDNRGALDDLWRIPGFRVNVQPDEQGLIEMAEAVTLVTRERIWRESVSTPEATAKLAFAIRRRSAMDDSAFDAALLAHGSKAASQRPACIYLSQSLVVSEEHYISPENPAAESQIDAIEFIGWRDLATLEEEWVQMQADFLEDLAVFADLDACAVIVTDERSIF
ncbi:MAG: EthD domain-containing protein [Thermomicrobiales bacterium]